MKTQPRRSFLKALGSVPFLLAFTPTRKTWAAESTPPTYPNARDLTNPSAFKPGYLSIIQGPTSDTQTLINVFAPRLKKYSYVAMDPAGSAVALEVYEKIPGPGFYNIDKLKVSNLATGVKYTLQVCDGETVVDQRSFSALNIRKKDPVFGLISCMADDYRFTDVIDPMWERLRKENPDFLILNGDAVYVDSFEFVERKKATEADLWQRYVDAFRRIPLYHFKKLIPTFATWDDHDFGTNDGDRDFQAKDAAAKLFHGAFGGKEIDGTWTQGPMGVSSVLKAFGQRFYFMDDRTFRQPNKNQTETESYGHWGQRQHEWLINHLSTGSAPAWIINGNQFFNGKALDFKEAFEANHSKEFTTFIGQLNQVSAPVIFASGDIHLSEIMRIPSGRTGYETYELTSSSMHSYAGDGWENPMRLEGAFCKEFNFMLIRSRNEEGDLRVNVKSLGLASDAYFEKNLSVKK